MSVSWPVTLTAVGVLWQVTDRFAIRPDVSWSWVVFSMRRSSIHRNCERVLGGGFGSFKLSRAAFRRATPRTTFGIGGFVDRPSVKRRWSVARGSSWLFVVEQGPATSTSTNISGFRGFRGSLLSLSDPAPRRQNPDRDRTGRIPRLLRCFGGQYQARPGAFCDVLGEVA